MANSYEIKNNRLILKNNGKDYLDDNEKKHIPNNFTEIEFPACYNQIYSDDFESCKSGLAKVTKLDFSKASLVEKISDGAFNGAKKLKVVVLPKKVEYISEFKQCPQLKEFHIFELKDTYTITDDKDKRLTVYANSVSSEMGSFSDGFLADVGILYVPQSAFARCKKIRDKYSDDLDIRVLPSGYSFPTVALDEPWCATSSSVSNTHNSSSSRSTSSSSFGGARYDVDPFSKEKPSRKYEVKVTKTGSNEQKLLNKIQSICGCTKQKAQEFINQLDDLLGDSEVCGTNSKADADKIAEELQSVGAKADVKTNAYRVELYEAGDNKQIVKKAMKSVCPSLSQSQLQKIIDDSELLGGTITTVDSADEANKIKRNIEQKASGCEVKIYTEYASDCEDDDDNFDLDDLLNEDDSDENPSFDIDQIFGGIQFHCVLEGQDFGPVTIRQFANMSRYGIVNGNTLVWKEGMSNWAVASSIADLQGII